jgi:hypothetical protein
VELVEQDLIGSLDGIKKTILIVLDCLRDSLCHENISHRIPCICFFLGKSFADGLRIGATCIDRVDERSRIFRIFLIVYYTLYIVKIADTLIETSKSWLISRSSDGCIDTCSPVIDIRITFTLKPFHIEFDLFIDFLIDRFDGNIVRDYLIGYGFFIFEKIGITTWAIVVSDRTGGIIFSSIKTFADSTCNIGLLFFSKLIGLDLRIFWNNRSSTIPTIIGSKSLNTRCKEEEEKEECPPAMRREHLFSKNTFKK